MARLAGGIQGESQRESSWPMENTMNTPTHPGIQKQSLHFVAGLAVVALAAQNFVSSPQAAISESNVLCSASELIRAIEVANSSSGPDTLTLTTGCVYTLTEAYPLDANTNGPTGLPSITGDLTINGGGATIERSTASNTPPFRIFHVSAAGRLTLKDVTLLNGMLQILPAAPAGDDGQAGQNGEDMLDIGADGEDGHLGSRGDDGSHAAGRAQGGGIYNSGQLVLQNCTLQNNRAVGTLGGGGGNSGDGGNGGRGGNAAFISAGHGGKGARGEPGGHGGDGGDAQGGAVYNNGGTVEISLCAFQGNQALAGAGGDGGDGGGGGNGGDGGRGGGFGDGGDGGFGGSGGSGGRGGGGGDVQGGAIYSSGGGIKIEQSTLENNSILAGAGGHGGNGGNGGSGGDSLGALGGADDGLTDTTNSGHGGNGGNGGNSGDGGRRGAAQGATVFIGDGTLEVIQSTLQNNSIEAGVGGGGGHGGAGGHGGNGGWCTVNEDGIHVQANDCNAGHGGGGGWGGWGGAGGASGVSQAGAIFITGNGNVEMRQSTFQNNQARAGAGGVGGAGGDAGDGGDGGSASGGTFHTTSLGGHGGIGGVGGLGRMGGASGVSQGGAVLVDEAMVKIEQSTLAFNHTSSASGGAGAGGGAGGTGGAGGAGLDTTGITGPNGPPGPSGFGGPTLAGGDGGAIYNGSGKLTLTNSTVSNNQSGAGGNGGGIYNTSGLILNNATLSRNRSGSGGSGGGIWNSSQVEAKNTIIADNPAGGDCVSNVGARFTGEASQDTDGTCPHFISVPSADLKLSPLADHGGPTRTHALLSGSTAINVIDPRDCTTIEHSPLTTDQRGVARPQGSACDVGAFEAEASAQSGPPWIVNNLGDTDDGVCGDFHCTLREAINASNSDGVASQIRFSVTGTILLDAVDNTTNGPNGLPSVTTAIIIEGDGITVARSSAAGTPGFRVFHVAATGNLTLNKVTVTNGALPTSVGVAAIRSGGGLYNAGTLTLNNSTISGNRGGEGTSGGPHGAAGGNGGGLFNATSGTLTVANSTVSGNLSGDGGNGGTGGNGGSGGGLFNAGTLTLSNSTVNGNHSGDGGGAISSTDFGADGRGGGLYNATGGAVTLNNSTLSGNRTITDTGSKDGGSLWNSGAMAVKNTLIANSPEGGNCAGPGAFTALGHNLATDGTCPGFSSVTSAELNLSPLADYGGPTRTHALLPGSKAINTAADCTTVDGASVTTDQRGVARPQGSGCDVGAFEVEVSQSGPPWVVNSLGNLDDGVCSDIHCTLREAINASNNDGVASQILFAVSGTILLDGVDNTTDGPNGLPSVTTPITIEGDGITVARSSAAGAPNFRVFHVAGSGNLALNEVTVTNGALPGASTGGGLYNAGTLALTHSTVGNNRTGLNGHGGGLYNTGTLALTNSTVSNNRTGLNGHGGGLYSASALTLTNSLISNNHTGANGVGGGLYNAGTLTLTHSTVSNNGSDRGSGGGIFNETSGALTVSDSLISNNLSGTGGHGGGIANVGALTLTHSTIISNQSGDGGNGRDGGHGGHGGGIFNSGTLTLTNSTISGNRSGDGGRGGGTIRDECGGGRGTVRGTGGAGGNGGGILNSGTLTLTNSTLSDNRNGDGGNSPGFRDTGGAGGSGGGILNTGVLTLTNSTLSGNRNGDGGSAWTAGSGGSGGGVWNNGTLTLTNSTLSHNSTGNGAKGGDDQCAGGDGGSGGSGGGILNHGSLTLNFGTVNGNTAGVGGDGGSPGGDRGSDGAGGGIWNNSTLQVKNTIIANSGFGGNCSGTITLSLNNLATDTTCSGFRQVGVNNLDLGPLADNGGLTWTHALLSHSAAINATNDCTTVDGGLVDTDQRGIQRPQGGLCDIGAFELETNDTPEIVIQQESVTVEEGQLAANLITVTDPENDPVTVRVSIGSLANAGPGDWSWSFTPNDGLTPPVEQMVRISASDGNSESRKTFNLIVLNVAATANFAATAGPIKVGDVAALSFTNPFDPGPADTAAGFRYAYDCTDDGAFELANSPSATFNCRHDEEGVFTARGRIMDKDGGFTDYTAQVIVNTPPVAVADSYLTDEDTLLNISGPGVLINDTDVGGDALMAALVSGPANGLLILSPDGSFSYTPNANFNGVDSFTYQANDGLANSSAATVTLTVNPVNDTPVSTTDAYNTDEDIALNVAAPGVLGNDGDVDGDILTAVLVSNPANGTLTLNSDGSFSYMPNANFNGADSLTYQANDGLANSNIATVTLIVNPVNDNPTVAPNNASVIVDEGQAAANTGTVSDVDGDPVALSASVGAVTNNGDGTWSWSLATDDGPAESQTVIITADDGQGGVTQTTFTLTVNNVAPTATFANLSDVVNPGGTATLAFNNPSDPSAADTAESFFYLFDCQGDGVFDAPATTTPEFDCTYPDAGAFNAIGRIQDKDGGFTDYSALVVVNTPPIAVDDSASTAQDTPVTISVLDNDSDPDGDPLVVIETTAPANGNVVVNPDNTITYTPNPGYHGPDSFTYTIADSGHLTASATVSITVVKFKLITPSTYSSCSSQPTSDTIVVTGVGNRQLRGQVIVEYVTGPHSRKLVPGGFYEVTHSGPEDFTLTVNYPPVTEWPFFIDPRTGRPVGEIHVDIQISVLDADGNLIRLPDGQVWTLGPGQDWDVYCLRPPID